MKKLQSLVNRHPNITILVFGFGSIGLGIDIASVTLIFIGIGLIISAGFKALGDM